MNLKSQRFDISWMCECRDNCDDGDDVNCDDVVRFINYQKQQFGMNAEKILELLIEELS